MPCDTIQETSLSLERPHYESLMKALEELGLNPRMTTTAGETRISFRGGSFQNGTITTRGNVEASEIRTRYASEVAKHAARRFGFRAVETTARTPGAIAAYKLVKNVR